MLDEPTLDPSEKHREAADLVLWNALKVMTRMGIPFNVILDRLFTAAGAHAVAVVGAAETAEDFRLMAASIEGGLFAQLEPTKPARH